ncbi:MAG: CARDB domain-containing protein, partial [Candidatus Thorarchaeota archaeon]
MRIGLLAVVVIVSLLGACAGPSASPEPAPTPEATPVPTIPTPSPQPEPPLMPTPPPPAEFQVVGLDISPNPAKVGQQTTIIVTIENIGGSEGTYNASLLLDGEVYHTSDVTLAGGTETSVSTVVSKDSPGSYKIKIGVQEAILEVIEVVHLETGTVFWEKESLGMARLEVNNKLDFDTVVVLCSVEE